MVSIASGLGLDVAHPNLLWEGPEKKKSKDILLRHDIKSQFKAILIGHLFEGGKWLMLYGGKDPVKPRTLVAFPWSCKGCPWQLLSIETIPGKSGTYFTHCRSVAGNKVASYLHRWGLFCPSGKAPGHRGSQEANSFPNPDWYLKKQRKTSPCVL